MRALVLGDIVGRAGRKAVERHLPALKGRYKPDFTIINAENSAGGFGITEAIYADLMALGADAVTLGNHGFDQREALVFIERAPALVRPINYPNGTPGRGAALIENAAGKTCLVINALGRIFMEPLDDPFAAIDDAITACPLVSGVDMILVDFHAEATSEKQALAHFLDGRATLVAGTHTHVPTADHRVLPGGTAYISDLGMTGDYDSVIGMGKDEPISRFVSRIPSARFEPAMGEATICGVVVEADPKTGLALSIDPVRTGGLLGENLP